MNNLPNVAQVGALIGDPVRATILGSLMDGSERPASELALLSGVSAQSASAHLSRLLDGGLLAVKRAGRNRFYRLRDGEVAYAIETLSVAADLPPRRRSVDPALKRARRCYDHVAGELGVAICDALVGDKRVVAGGDGYALSAAGDAWLAAVQLERPVSGRRPIVRPCVDWTERRPHLAGWLGAAILGKLEMDGVVHRSASSRALTVVPTKIVRLNRDFRVVWPRS